MTMTIFLDLLSLRDRRNKQRSEFNYFSFFFPCESRPLHREVERSRRGVLMFSRQSDLENLAVDPSLPTVTNSRTKFDTYGLP